MQDARGEEYYKRCAICQKLHFEIGVVLSNNITVLKFYLRASSLIHLMPTSQSSFQGVRPNLFTVNM